jgi:drug/metabolite transporter (DMT)-like permease
MNDSLAILGLCGSILFLSAGQIAQKFAARQIFDVAAPRALLIRVLYSPALWIAAACLTTGTLFWLLTLSRIEVSKAYPMLSLSFVLTTVLARACVGEAVNRRRWLGVSLVCAGAALMAAA